MRAVLIFSLALAALASTIALADPTGPPNTSPATAPRLEPKAVLALAAAALAGRTEVRYKAGVPRYFPDKRVWWVYCEDLTLTIDGEMLVVVDDRTGRTCTQQAMAVGPCT